MQTISNSLELVWRMNLASLEEALRAAAEKGLTHFSMWPVPSADGKKTYWRASCAPSTGHHYVAVSGEDPVKAAIEALQNLPAARKRKAATATVTEPLKDTQP